MNLPTPSPMSFCASFLVWPSTIYKIKGMALSYGWIVIRCCELNTVKTRTNQMISLRTTRVFGKNLYIYIANHIAALRSLFNMHVQCFKWYKFSLPSPLGMKKFKHSVCCCASVWSCYGTATIQNLQTQKSRSILRQDGFWVYSTR